jgi:hypothetical protein
MEDRRWENGKTNAEKGTLISANRTLIKERGGVTTASEETFSTFLITLRAVVCAESSFCPDATIRNYSNGFGGGCADGADVAGGWLVE